MSQNTSKKPRVPLAINGIQVNYCKNPQCANFGVPASTESQKKKGVIRDKYTVMAAGKNYPYIKCHVCGEFPPIKSNQAISDELNRLKYYLTETEKPSCKNELCENHQKSIKYFPKLYRHFGTTRSGSKRYLCKSCKKTFSVGKSTLRQKQPHKNELIFKLLVNKSPYRRILNVADIHPQTLYDKIDFIHKQCMAYVSEQERLLISSFHAERLYLSTDRQDYYVNWMKRADKRNIKLSAVATSDNVSGYVFGMHLNYDPEADLEIVNQDVGDFSGPHRKHAQYWLPYDYDESVSNNRTTNNLNNASLPSNIEQAYNEAASRTDVEVSEQQDRTLSLPIKGLQVHSEYTLYAHFMLMAELFQNVDKVRFFLDQDSGIRAACLSAFNQRVKDRTADAFYVSINKDLTVDEKRQYVQESKANFIEARKALPHLTENEVKLQLIKSQISQMDEYGKWKDRWMLHPFPDMSEPEKAVCYLTDLKDYDIDHQAWLYNKATLHGVDRYFMQIRRRISLLERPIHSASQSGRVWHGYSAYNPAMIIKMLDIFRVYFNFIQTGKDKQTPAQRLGLARNEITISEILNYLC